jgi:hypothetical protein
MIITHGDSIFCDQNPFMRYIYVHEYRRIKKSLSVYVCLPACFTNLSYEIIVISALVCRKLT